MGRNKRARRISRKRVKRKFPSITIDTENDFAAIKLRAGVEARSYQKRGFIFCEDKLGRLIEIQILNLPRSARKKVA